MAKLPKMRPYALAEMLVNELDGRTPMDTGFVYSANRPDISLVIHDLKNRIDLQLFEDGTWKCEVRGF